MSVHRTIVFLLTLSVCLVVTANACAAAPAWDIQSISSPNNFLPGEESGEDKYQVFIVNNGGEVTDGTPITITDTLPKGLGVQSLELRSPRGLNPNISGGCQPPVTIDEVTTVSCKVTNKLQPDSEPAVLNPSNVLFLQINVTVPSTAAGTLVNQVEVNGGGAAAVSAKSENEASFEEAQAGFEEFQTELTGPDGLPVVGAGTRPYQFTTAVAVNTVKGKTPGSPQVTAGGDLKNVEVSLPPGLAGNQLAVERCTARQFNTNLVNGKEGAGG